MQDVKLVFMGNKVWKNSLQHLGEKTYVCNSSTVIFLDETSLRGCKYFLCFIYDFSQMTWAYFFKAKSEAFDHFKEFHQLIERKTKENIDTLRTNNGGVFSSNGFHNYCKDKGTKRQFAYPYTPHQNGVIERLN